MVLRLTVPAAGDLRAIARDIATKVAEYVGTAGPEAESIADALDGAAARVAPPGSDVDISFEFQRADGELTIRARSGDRSSEVRCKLPVE
jgi:hypothetical protein